MTSESKRNALSNEFKVAVAIFEITEKLKEKAWSTKLQVALKDYMGGSTVLRMLTFLESWRIVKTQYGETETGRPGKLYYLSNEDHDTIEMLYERYWKE